MASTTQAQMPAITVDDFVSRQFDYLIIGAGTSGLVVAARLSEHAGVNVGVIEAGRSALDEDAIKIPGLFGETLGSTYDWQFETVAQPGLGDRKLAWPRGKVLGGTSALNFMAWNRANREDYDAWRDLGNKGWGWDDLLPYFKKSETFHRPNDHDAGENILLHDKDTMGYSGPVKVSYAREYSASHGLWHETMRNLGVETNARHLAGSNVGAWTNMGSVDSETGHRSYSATAYYMPNTSRPNLAVLTEAMATEIVLEQGEEGWTATGVRFQKDGVSHFVGASREVVLSAGSVQSPQILELSGIGDAEVLRKANVPVKIDMKGVGENLQDHMMAAMIFEVDPAVVTADDWKRDQNARKTALQQFRSDRSGPLAVLANSIAYVPSSKLSSDEKALIGITKHGKDTKLGEMEFLFDLGNWNYHFRPEEGKKYATCLQILQYPFSVGSIHITSNVVSDKPAIDPQYYSGESGDRDLALMVHAARFADKIKSMKPLADIIRRRVFPPEAEVEDEVFWRKWLIETTTTDWHPVGTCAMGTVVDERLRVKGVQGLRVLDASIIPLQISAHLQATVYAIGEKGAAMILEDAMLV